MRPSYLLERGWQEHEGTATTQAFQDTLFTRHYLLILILYLSHLRTLGTPWKVLAGGTSESKDLWRFSLPKLPSEWGQSSWKLWRASNVFRKSCAGGLWDLGQDSLDHRKKPLVFFKQPRSKAFNKETQQTPSVNQARKAEAILNTVLCVMQLFPHASRETQTTKDTCVWKCCRSTPFTGNRSMFGTAEHKLNGVISNIIKLPWIHNCKKFVAL